MVETKRSRRKATTDVSEGVPKTARLLADPRAYQLVRVVDFNAGSVAPADQLPAVALRPPVSEFELEQTDMQQAVPTRTPVDDAPTKPVSPSHRYSNQEIQDAARPYVEAFELERGCTITRQPPRVGADFRATDGRYIELKAFGDGAPSSFDLEPFEWRAAKNPNIASHYWVYIVDHLLDGKPPRVVAIRNPVVDEMVTKQATGKLRIRGWQSAHEKQEGTFAIASGADRPERGQQG